MKKIWTFVKKYWALLFGGLAAVLAAIFGIRRRRPVEAPIQPQPLDPTTALGRSEAAVRLAAEDQKRIEDLYNKAVEQERLNRAARQKELELLAQVPEATASADAANDYADQIRPRTKP